MKKTHNERNAGRKKKYNVPVKLIRVPEPILEQVNELSKPYETSNKDKRQIIDELGLLNCKEIAENAVNKEYLKKKRIQT